MNSHNNVVKIVLTSRSANEAFARTAISSFVSILDPTLEELSDIKTAVSEAVTNCIVHAYKEQIGFIYITVKLTPENKVVITVRDRGCGIEDVQKALEPEFTTCPEGERSGIGFSVMEAFMDKLSVRSTVGRGTTVTLTKKINSKGSD